jgi:hypothetical protein
MKLPYPFYDGEILLVREQEAKFEGFRQGRSLGLAEGARGAATAMGWRIKANGIPNPMKDTIMMEYPGELVERMIHPR